jgi:AcrR family transcriptional regulator
MMGVPARLVPDDQLLDRLTALFRDRGFDAATLQEIAHATGLQKSSLYHRFPGGKQQMATEVAVAIGAQFAGHLLAPLAADAPLRARLERVARNLAEFYADGRRSCVLEALSIGTVGGDAADALRTAAGAWIDAFTAVARAGGADRRLARARAQDAIASIEGGLILARVTGDASAFRRTLARLPDLLLDPS